MATRLQQDDAKGQANWADIDDDDEDWAPEEIRWTDGTKSTIPHHEEISQPVQEQPPQLLERQPHEHAQQLPMPLPSAGSQPSPTVPVTLLSRDSAIGEQPKSPAPMVAKVGGLPSGRGLILKHAPEKPTLVAKPPAPPTPVKSPWATLPPVDKSSPAVIDQAPPVGGPRMPYQQLPFHQYPHSQRDLYSGPPRGSSPPLPFKEISADDFSRGGFRDAHPHMHRELFNAQSGRMEPVMDRRGSSRSDMPYRQHPSAVLQRPTHSMDQQPEPSPAFQTHRSSAQEGPYGRRRNSSNVSGGSGSFLQRIGRPHDQHGPPELLSARQPSLTGRSDSPASPRNYSPSGSRSWQNSGSPNATFATPFANAPAAGAAQPPVPGGPPPPGANLDDELELQKKIMRERRELAKKRRMEEEEREEAAKRERIRLKLEAMGPAPERKSAKKDVSKDETATAAAGSPEASTPSAISKAEPTTVDGGNDTASPSVTQAVPERDDSSAAQVAARSHVMASQHHTQQQSPQSWQGPAPPQSERIASWSSSNQSLRNVWGSPNNRSLGNGTFNSDLVRVGESFTPGSPLPLASKPGPGPIRPPTAPKSAPGPSIAPIGPPKPAPLAASSSVPGQVIGTQPISTAADSSTSVTRSAWASAVKAGDEALLAQQKALRAEQKREAEAQGLALKDLRPAIKDTWMPTRMNEDGNRIEDKSNQSVMHRQGNVVSTGTAPASTIHPQQTRPSRFFPTRDVRLEEAASAVAGTAPAVSGTRSTRPGSPSPPPPDMDGHPAFDGDAAHPHVSLPRPQIVVRLPPKGTTGNDLQTHHVAPRTPASQHQGHMQVPLSDDMSWQAKIDTLLERKVVSPLKPTSGAGRAEYQSRSMADHERGSAHHHASPAPRVVLAPARYEKPAVPESVTTRTMAEECFERQEMGSLPIVHLPNKAPELAWIPATVPKPLPRRFFVTSTTTSDHDGFLKDLLNQPHIVNIRLPGMRSNGKTVSLPSARTHSNPRRSGLGRGGGGRGGGGGGGGGGGSGGTEGGGRSLGSHRGGGNKARDTASVQSGSHGNEQRQSSNTSRTNSGGGRSRGGNGGSMRQRSENWTRGSPASIQT